MEPKPSEQPKLTDFLHTGKVSSKEQLEIGVFKNWFDWYIALKIVTICTDNVRNITNGLTEAHFKKFLSSTHTLQLSLNKAFSIAATDNLLMQSKKFVGHLKHSSTNSSKLS